jgi:superfamily I DNA and RNA helicase
MFVAQSMVLVINCEARNTERNNKTKNNILEYMKKSTMRRVNEDDPMQRDIAELNRLKQNKNRKYN